MVVAIKIKPFLDVVDKNVCKKCWTFEGKAFFRSGTLPIEGGAFQRDMFLASKMQCRASFELGSAIIFFGSRPSTHPAKAANG